MFCIFRFLPLNCIRPTAVYNFFMKPPHFSVYSSFTTYELSISTERSKYCMKSRFCFNRPAALEIHAPTRFGLTPYILAISAPDKPLTFHSIASIPRRAVPVYCRLQFCSSIQMSCSSSSLSSVSSALDSCSMESPSSSGSLWTGSEI